MLQLRAVVVEQHKAYDDYAATVFDNLDLQQRLAAAGHYKDNPLPPDPMPDLVERGKEVEVFNASIEKLAKQVSQPAMQLKRHLRQQWIAFVLLPLLFAAAAFILCIIAIGRALHATGSVNQTLF